MLHLRAHGAPCVMGADAYTFPAVYTAIGVNLRLAVMNPDSLGGTAFKARGTALALFHFQRNRMFISIHKQGAIAFSNENECPRTYFPLKFM